MLWLYRVLAALAGPLIIIAATLKRRYGGPFKERLGLGAPWPTSGALRLWLHAASLGETKTALNLIKTLHERRPDIELVLSVGTPTALKLARSQSSLSPDKLKVVAAPVDFWGAPARALRRLNPRTVIIVETELWPNFIWAVSRQKRALFWAAGRISKRSFSRYRLIAGFMGQLLGRFDRLAMIGFSEAQRAAALGAPAERMLVAGNPKYDQLLAQAAADAPSELLQQAFPGPLIVAGSTHPGEEALILAAFKELRRLIPELTLAIAPRHVQRAGEIAGLSRQAGFETRLWDGCLAGKPPAPVTVIAATGQLFSLYALSEIALIGGSWARADGHNPLEAAAWGKPMLFGPGMDEFREVADSLLLAGAAKEVNSPAELAQAAQAWLNDAGLALKGGRAGRRYLENRAPVAPRLADMILELSVRVSGDGGFKG